MAVSIKIMKPTLGCANQKSNITRKQASMARMEEAATEFIAKPPKERDTLDYVSSGKSFVFFFTRSTALPTKVSKEIDLTQEDILAECSHNVNLLFNLLDNVNKGESFVKQKKSRDIRCKDIFFAERVNKFVNKALSWSGTTAFRFF